MADGRLKKQSRGEDVADLAGFTEPLADDEAAGMMQAQNLL